MSSAAMNSIFRAPCPKRTGNGYVWAGNDGMAEKRQWGMAGERYECDGDSMAIGIMSGQETVVLEMSTPFSGGVATAMTLRARQVCRDGVCRSRQRRKSRSSRPRQIVPPAEFEAEDWHPRSARRRVCRIMVARYSDRCRSCRFIGARHGQPARTRL